MLPHLSQGIRAGVLMPDTCTKDLHFASTCNIYVQLPRNLASADTSVRSLENLPSSVASLMHPYIQGSLTKIRKNKFCSQIKYTLFHRQRRFCTLIQTNRIMVQPHPGALPCLRRQCPSLHSRNTIRKRGVPYKIPYVIALLHKCESIVASASTGRHRKRVLVAPDYKCETTATTFVSLSSSLGRGGQTHRSVS